MSLLNQYHPLFINVSVSFFFATLASFAVSRSPHDEPCFYNIRYMSESYILGIESSCDETAAAVVSNGEHVLSNVVSSQIATHQPYGGVVPELASREHLRAIVPVVRQALAEAGKTYESVDAIAVTQGPGLAGALLVGISYAKALAFASGKAAHHREPS